MAFLNSCFPGAEDAAQLALTFDTPVDKNLEDFLVFICFSLTQRSQPGYEGY